MVNLGGAINVFETAVNKNVPVIYASSAAIYGSSQNIPLKEDSEIIAASPYGFDKYSTEAHAKLFANLRGLKSVGLRFFNVYGSRQDPTSPYSGVISIFINKILKNEKVQIFGDGNQIRDFIYVNDVVEALIKANNKKTLDTSSSFNVCTGKGTTINSLIEILGELLNKQVEVEYLLAPPGDIYKSIGDPLKLEKVIGYKAGIGIRQGLQYLLSDMQP
jgi:UDP-glucose 4-epimerase